jgi:hypothetical protein
MVRSGSWDLSSKETLGKECSFLATRLAVLCVLRAVIKGV